MGGWAQWKGRFRRYTRMAGQLYRVYSQLCVAPRCAARCLPSARQTCHFIAGSSLARRARRLGHARETEEVPDPAHVVG